MKSALLLCLIVCLVFALNLNLVGLGSDFSIHYSNALTLSSNYKPLFPLLAHSFTVSQDLFKDFAVLLFALMLPMVLVFVTGKDVIAWFYFSTTSLFYTIIPGLYGQGLTFILLSLMFIKNNWLRASLFILSFFVHSQAPYLIGATWIALCFMENKNDLKLYFKKYYTKIGVVINSFCSPFWGKKIPEVLNQNLNLTGGNNADAFMTGNHLLALFFKLIPLPFLYFSLKAFWIKQKELIVLMIAIFIASFFISARVLYVLPVFMLLGVTQYYASASKNQQKLIIYLSVLCFAFQLEQFLAVSLKFFC